MTILTMILRAQQWRDGWRLKTHLVSPNQGAAAAQPGSGAKWRRVETNRRPILTESSSFKETNPEKALSRKTPFASSSYVAPTWWHHSFSFLAPGREKKIHFFLNCCFFFRKSVPPPLLCSRGNLFRDSIICVQVDILFCAESVKTTPRPMLSGRLKFLISKFNWTKTINFPRRCCTTFSNIYRTSTKRGAAIVTTERKSFYLWNRCSRHRNTKALTGVCFH